MYVVIFAALMIIASYLYGSLNYAVIITRLVSGKDIRLLGNKNPGTANVGRSIGRGWAAAVFFLDISKSLLPLILARKFFFSGNTSIEIIILFAIGIAAVGGHCRPVYYRFRGGGGIATSMGIYFYFVPAEFGLSILLSLVLVMVFVKGVRYRLTQWIPVLFVAIAPVLTTVFYSIPPVEIRGIALTGGYSRSVLVGIYALSLFVLWMNRSFMGERLREIRK